MCLLYCNNFYAVWQNSWMNNFKTWLDDNDGMATVLAQKLSINRSNITNAKRGRLLMPTGWMPKIVELSNGLLTFEDLVLEREYHRQIKINDRTAAAR